MLSMPLLNHLGDISLISLTFILYIAFLQTMGLRGLLH